MSAVEPTSDGLPVLIEWDHSKLEGRELLKSDLPKDDTKLFEFLTKNLNDNGRVLASQPACNIAIGLWLIHVQYDPEAKRAFAAGCGSKEKPITTADLNKLVMERFSISPSTVTRCRKVGAVWRILKSGGYKVPLAHSHLFPLEGLDPKQTCHIWKLVELKYGTKITEEEVRIVVAEETGTCAKPKKSSYDAIKERTREFLDGLNSFFEKEIGKLTDNEKIEKSVIKRIADEVSKQVQDFRPIVDPAVPAKKKPKKKAKTPAQTSATSTPPSPADSSSSDQTADQQNDEANPGETPPPSETPKPNDAEQNSHKNLPPSETQTSDDGNIQTIGETEFWIKGLTVCAKNPKKPHEFVRKALKETLGSYTGTPDNTWYRKTETREDADALLKKLKDALNSANTTANDPE